MRRMSNQIQGQNIFNAKHIFNGLYYNFSNVVVDYSWTKLYFFRFLLR
jgi:hypothetical protein